MTLRAHTRRFGGSAVTQTSAALVLSQVFLGLAGVIAARALGPTGRGIVVGVTTWMGTLPAILLLGMNTSLQVGVAEGRRSTGQAAANALAFLVICGIPAGLIAAVVVPDLIGGLGPHAATLARWAMLLGLPAAIASEMLLGIALAQRRFGVFNISRMLLPLLPLGVATGYFIAGGLTPTLMVIASIGATFAVLCWLVVATSWENFHFDRPAFLADVRFGAKTSVANWTGLVNARLDFLLMSVFVAAGQLGYYGVANNVMLVITAVPFAAATVLVPRVASVAAELGSAAAVAERQFEIVVACVRRYFAVALAGGITLGVAAPFVVPLVFGHAFRPTVTLIWILIPGYVARTTTAIIADGANAMRRPRVAIHAELAAVVVTVVLLAALLPYFAATGAAIATTAAYCTSAAIALNGLRRIRNGALGRSNESVIVTPQFGDAP